VPRQAPRESRRPRRSPRINWVLPQRHLLGSQGTKVRPSLPARHGDPGGRSGLHGISRSSGWKCFGSAVARSFRPSQRHGRADCFFRRTKGVLRNERPKRLHKGLQGLKKRGPRGRWLAGGGPTGSPPMALGGRRDEFASQLPGRKQPHRFPLPAPRKGPGPGVFLPGGIAFPAAQGRIGRGRKARTFEAAKARTS